MIAFCMMSSHGLNWVLFSNIFQFGEQLKITWGYDGRVGSLMSQKNVVSNLNQM